MSSENGRRKRAPAAESGGTAAGDGTAAVRQPDDRRLSAFPPIRLQKAADAVIAVVADAIRAGLYEPGDLLPAERNLAAQLQVSRTVVREAIDVLRREGIVSVKRGAAGGATVVSTRGLHEVVSRLQGKTHDLMQWSLEARRALELPAFLLAAARATDEDVAGLEPLVAGLADLAEDHEAFYRLDQKFHREVVRLSGNPLLVEHYNATLAQLAEIRAEFPVLQVLYDQAYRNQQVLYAALRSRDPEQIRPALDEHLAATEIIYLGRPLQGF